MSKPIIQNINYLQSPLHGSMSQLSNLSTKKLRKYAHAKHIAVNESKTQVHASLLASKPSRKAPT